MTGAVVQDLGDASRPCGWCRRPIPTRARRDSKYCGVRCRQAAHRFQAGRTTRAIAEHPMRFGYADPPYPTKARQYYADHPDYAGEVDHAHLVAALVAEFPHGWALSTSAAALPAVLALCPPGVKVAAWVRGERPARSYDPLPAWEPVIYYGGRPQLREPADRRVDALVYASRPRTTEPDRVVGAKPGAFCWWLFDLLGARPGDDLVDLFPGSGGVAKAWRMYVAEASTSSPHDASPPGSHDASTAGRPDASRPGHHDTSPGPGPDASHLQPVDASTPSPVG